METQSGPISLEVSVDEGALVSQVLEIIGGNAAEALTTLVEPQEEQEEGDDSVFLSDEDQDGEDVETEAACSSGQERPGVGAAEIEIEEIPDVRQRPGSGEDKQLQDLQMYQTEEESQVVDQEALLSLPVEAELKNSAEPGEFSWRLIAEVPCFQVTCVQKASETVQQTGWKPELL